VICFSGFARDPGGVQVEQSIDYQEVGLIAGLEVHQQLLTERKMFCHCPARRYTDKHDGEVLRHMRPTLSELGEYDGTALMEFKTRKNIVYLLHKSNVCTYEMDDTPPFLANQQALDIAVEQCLMLGCDIVDEVHIARKQYLDGSIPTGFQRTAIVGVNGKLPFRGRTLSITQVSVEEDSCREVSDRGHLIVWRADRLGMPLIETVTGPDLRTPEEVEEAILLVGRVCRSTGHVRVGLGASRQDVNVSVRGGRRVEIKGVPKAGWAPALVHGEAVRQVGLLRLRDELHSRGIQRPDQLSITDTDVTRLFENSLQPFLRASNWERYIQEEELQSGFELGAGPFCVRAVHLRDLAWTLTWPTQPEHVFAHELAGRVRVVAGLDQQPILLSSEAWSASVDAQRELRELRRKLQGSPEDGIIVVWGPEQDTLTAAQEIRLRYEEALDGVPNETRQPFADGSTDFERILPGPDRMYPDTDSPPIEMTRARVERLRTGLPPTPWEREERYAVAGVPVETIHYLIRRNGAALVDRVVRECGTDLRAACIFFGQRLKSLRRDGIAVAALAAEDWCALFGLFAKRPVLEEAWRPIIKAFAADPSSGPESAAAGLGLNDGAPDWRERVKENVASLNPNLVGGDPPRLFRLHMGLLMRELRGRIPAADVLSTLEQELTGSANHG
ncbi:MAG: Glu-tRNA(Gln) amidotransferase subunit GatE, partial [Planctomycetota bacterium]